VKCDVTKARGNMQEIYMLCPLHSESGVCVRNSVCNKPITKRMSAKRRSEGLVFERAGAGKRETVGVHACLRSTEEQEVGDGKLRRV
jgi:hypothetical protein